MSEQEQESVDAPETTPAPPDVEEGGVEEVEEIEEGTEEDEETSEGVASSNGAGPAEDIQNDPAYNPDDPALKGIKGG